MEDILHYWPIATGFVFIVAWLVRMEAKTKEHDERIKEKANNETVAAAMTTVATLGTHIKEFYATKVEVATVTGAVGGLSSQMMDVRQSTQRIESKVDALLMSKAQESLR